MALDGITINNLVHDFKETILNGRINKIAQPEKDALMLTIKAQSETKKLFLSANPSLPLAYFTDMSKANPMAAPNFCMLLRKHIANGRIIDIYQPNFERIIVFVIEHLNELGDPCKKKLIIELMGKHSNIIFCDENDMILDSIKHIPASVSSVREVLPGRDYFIPTTKEKFNPLTTTKEEFYQAVFHKPYYVSKAIYQTYTGVSPVAASELCCRANIDGDRPTDALSETEKMHLFHMFTLFFEEVSEGRFLPQIIYQEKEPWEYTCFDYVQFADLNAVKHSAISQTLETFYADKEIYHRIRQKSVDLRRVVTTALERNRKKYDLQLKQLNDTKKKDTYKIYGELLHTYGYDLTLGAKKLDCINYYDNTQISIPLDETKNAMENAQSYFDKYNKLKRTQEAVVSLIEETKQEIEHLESVLSSLDFAHDEDDLIQIKEELILSGYIRRHFNGNNGNNGNNGKKVKFKSQPYHYRSSDGFDIYVGKNNLQNEEITFKVANGNDWWFHAKKIPGSHVVIKGDGRPLPDRAFEEAAKLAAYYSKARGSDKVEIDYVQRKEIKKPNGSKPGFVVYYTNYSLMADCDISDLTLVEDA